MKKRERKLRFRAAKKLASINSKMLDIQRILSKYEKITMEIRDDVDYRVWCKIGDTLFPLEQIVQNIRPEMIRRIQEITKD